LQAHLKAPQAKLLPKLLKELAKIKLSLNNKAQKAHLQIKNLKLHMCLSYEPYKILFTHFERFNNERVLLLNSI
jgi:hypothetical protein